MLMRAMEGAGREGRAEGSREGRGEGFGEELGEGSMGIVLAVVAWGAG